MQNNQDMLLVDLIYREKHSILCTHDPINGDPNNEIC